MLILTPGTPGAATIQASYRNGPATAFGDSPAGYESPQVANARTRDQYGYAPATVRRTSFAAAYFVRQR